MGRKTKYWLFGLLLSVLVVFVIGVGAEFLVRAIQSERGHVVETLFEIDEGTGLRVPISGFTSDQLTISTRGFRSPELVTPKPAERVRLAFLGGSTTISLEVKGNENTWPHRVWTHLSEAHPGVTFDYLNAAVSGYGVSHSLRRLEAQVAPAEPNIIVILHGYNDMTANSFALAKAEGLITERPAKESWLARQSVLWNLLEKNVKVFLRQQSEEASAEGTLEGFPAALGEEFRADLTALVEGARRQAEMVVLVTMAPRLRPGLSAEEQRDASVTARFYMPYLTMAAIADGYTVYNQVIKEVGASTGSLVVEAESFLAPEERFYTDSIHFTAEGSRVMAERISEALLASPAFAALLEARKAHASN